MARSGRCRLINSTPPKIRDLLSPRSHRKLPFGVSPYAAECLRRLPRPPAPHGVFIVNGERVFRPIHPTEHVSFHESGTRNHQTNVRVTRFPIVIYQGVAGRQCLFRSAFSVQRHSGLEELPRGRRLLFVCAHLKIARLKNTGLHDSLCCSRRMHERRNRARNPLESFWHHRQQLVAVISHRRQFH